jgi:hypothetical protein
VHSGGVAGLLAPRQQDLWQACLRRQLAAASGALPDAQASDGVGGHRATHGGTPHLQQTPGKLGAAAERSVRDSATSATTTTAKPRPQQPLSAAAQREALQRAAADFLRQLPPHAELDAQMPPLRPGELQQNLGLPVLLVATRSEHLAASAGGLGVASGGPAGRLAAGASAGSEGRLGVPRSLAGLFAAAAGADPQMQPLLASLCADPAVQAGLDRAGSALALVDASSDAPANAGGTSAAASTASADLAAAVRAALLALLSGSAGAAADAGGTLGDSMLSTLDALRSGGDGGSGVGGDDSSGTDGSAASAATSAAVKNLLAVRALGASAAGTASAGAEPSFYTADYASALGWAALQLLTPLPSAAAAAFAAACLRLHALRLGAGLACLPSPAVAAAGATSSAAGAGGVALATPAKARGTGAASVSVVGGSSLSATSGGAASPAERLWRYVCSELCRPREDALLRACLPAPMPEASSAAVASPGTAAALDSHAVTTSTPVPATPAGRAAAAAATPGAAAAAEAAAAELLHSLTAQAPTRLLPPAQEADTSAVWRMLLPAGHDSLAHITDALRRDVGTATSATSPAAGGAPAAGDAGSLAAGAPGASEGMVASPPASSLSAYLAALLSHAVGPAAGPTAAASPSAAGGGAASPAACGDSEEEGRIGAALQRALTDAGAFAAAVGDPRGLPAAASEPVTGSAGAVPKRAVSVRSTTSLAAALHRPGGDAATAEAIRSLGAGSAAGAAAVAVSRLQDATPAWHDFLPSLYAAQQALRHTEDAGAAGSGAGGEGAAVGGTPRIGAAPGTARGAGPGAGAAGDSLSDSLLHQLERTSSATAAAGAAGGGVGPSSAAGGQAGAAAAAAGSRSGTARGGPALPPLRHGGEEGGAGVGTPAGAAAGAAGTPLGAGAGPAASPSAGSAAAAAAGGSVGTAAGAAAPAAAGAPVEKKNPRAFFTDLMRKK